MFLYCLNVGLDIFNYGGSEENVLERGAAFEILFCEFDGLGRTGSLIGEYFLRLGEATLLYFDSFRRVASVLSAELDILRKSLESTHLANLLISIEFHP